MHGLWRRCSAPQRTHPLAGPPDSPSCLQFPGIINGGIVSAIFDCHGNWTAAIALMDKACLPKPPLTLTFEMLVRAGSAGRAEDAAHAENAVGAVGVVGTAGWCSGGQGPQRGAGRWVGLAAPACYLCSAGAGGGVNLVRAISCCSGTSASCRVAEGRVRRWGGASARATPPARTGSARWARPPPLYAAGTPRCWCRRGAPGMAEGLSLLEPPPGAAPLCILHCRSAPKCLCSSGWREHSSWPSRPPMPWGVWVLSGTLAARCHLPPLDIAPAAAHPRLAMRERRRRAKPPQLHLAPLLTGAPRPPSQTILCRGKCCTKLYEAV